MSNGYRKGIKVPLCAFITLLLTHCYSILAIVDKKGYTQDLQRNYKIEDFLWSGSGDGENETEIYPTEGEIWWEYTKTIFHTTTVISTSTVIHSTFSYIVTTSRTNATFDCTDNANCAIKPSPPTVPPSNTIISPWPPPDYRHPFFDQAPDQRYWLITVLKLNRVFNDDDVATTEYTVISTTAVTVNFSPIQLEDNLAKLYKLAFRRHQERHLGLYGVRGSGGNGQWNSTKSTLRSLNGVFGKRRRRRGNNRDEEVIVNIHNISSNHLLNILYSVRVSGHPVLATTAAYDMKYVSDAEVVAELGYPVLTKAEPYFNLHQTSTQDLTPSKKSHLLAIISGGVTAALVILFCVLTFIAVKKYKTNRTMNEKKIENEQFFKSKHGQRNVKDTTHDTTETKSNNGDEQNNLSTTRDKNYELDPSPVESASNSQVRNHSRSHHSHRPASPNSFLSMPSVKHFPTTPLPEPLTDVLTRDNSPNDKNTFCGQKFSRHSSLGDEDPGVVGPVVWDAFCQQQEKRTLIETGYSMDGNIDHVRQMRKRFNELLDDALDLYENRKSSDEDEVQYHRAMPKQSDCSRSQSIVPLKKDTNFSKCFNIHSRPQTSFNSEQRGITAFRNIPEPRNAWCSSEPSTSAKLNTRPLSAGPFHRPVIRSEFIFADANLSPNDPARPVISAIKQELDKIPSHDKKVSKEFVKMLSSERR